MIEIAPGLWLGDAADCAATRGKEGWGTLHASKVCHKRIVGYSGWAAPKDSPEYLWAERGNELALNFIDAPVLAMIPDAMIDHALAWLDEPRFPRLLIHCDEGRSRAPALALLHLWQNGFGWEQSVDDVFAAFGTLYPPFAPGTGVEAMLRGRLERGKKETP